MKARVKATGEVVDVVKGMGLNGSLVFTNSANGLKYLEEELEFEEYHIPRVTTPEQQLKEISTQMGKILNNQLDSDYWTRLEHQYAGMAMQAMLTSPELMQVVTGAEKLLTKGYAEKVAIVADKYAHALVEKMKEERK